METLDEMLANAKYPACIGLSQIGTWGRVNECWNDGKSRSKWYLIWAPMSMIGFDRDGSYLSLKKFLGKKYK